MVTKQKILIVDDDENIAFFVLVFGTRPYLKKLC